MSTPVLADKDQQGREIKNFKLESQTTVDIADGAKYAGGLKFDSTLNKIVGSNNGTSYEAIATETFATAAGTSAVTSANAYTDGKVTTINSTLENKQVNNPGISTKTPILPSDISINYTTKILTITKTDFEFTTIVNGVATRHKKTAAVSFPAWSASSGVKYFYFDNAGTAITSDTPWAFDGTKALVYRILWNQTTGESAAEAFECHQDTLSADAHSHFHFSEGAICKSGHDLFCNPITGNTAPSANGLNTVIGLSTGLYCDDNININVINCYPSAPAAVFEQDMGEITSANLTISTGGKFVIKLDTSATGYGYLPATRFPFDFTGDIPNYITTTGTRTAVGNGNYFMYFMYELSDPRAGLAIKLVSAPVDFTTIEAAEAYLWENIQSAYPTLRDSEIRVLYKLVFQYKSTYDAAVKKTALRSYTDLRKAILKQDALLGGSLSASNVVVTPSGNLSSTNGQSAFLELQSDIDNINYGTVVAGEDILLDDFICIKAGLAYKANATDASKMKVCGISTLNALTGATVTYLKRGKWTMNAAHGWTVDSDVPIYAHTTSGKGTVTPPAVNGNRRQILGFALSTTAIEFNPDNLSLTYYE